MFVNYSDNRLLDEKEGSELQIRCQFVSGVLMVFFLTSEDQIRLIKIISIYGNRKH